MFSKSDGQPDLNGFLDQGSKLQGELRFDASFRVDGDFEGSVRSSGRLVVGEDGKLDAEIHVGHLLVSGEVRGSVKAAEQIQIASGGRLLADIETPSLLIEDGAIFEGRCSMTGKGDKGGAKGGSEAARSGGDSVTPISAKAGGE